MKIMRKDSLRSYPPLTTSSKRKGKAERLRSFMVKQPSNTLMAQIRHQRPIFNTWRTFFQRDK